MNVKDFSTEKNYPANDVEGGRTVFYSPNLLSVFDWICERNGVKKYRRSRLWKLYKLLEMVDFIGTDKESLEIIRVNMICEYHDFSDSVIESDLRLLARLGLVVVSQTNNAPDVSALVARSKERRKWEDSVLVRMKPPAEGAADK